MSSSSNHVCSCPAKAPHFAFQTLCELSTLDNASISPYFPFRYAQFLGMRRPIAARQALGLPERRQLVQQRALQGPHASAMPENLRPLWNVRNGRSCRWSESRCSDHPASASDCERWVLGPNAAGKDERLSTGAVPVQEFHLHGSDARAVREDVWILHLASIDGRSMFVHFVHAILILCFHEVNCLIITTPKSSTVGYKPVATI